MTSWLITTGGAIVVLIVAWLQGRLSGAKAERDANRAKEADAYEKHLHDVASAASARNSVRPGGMSNDRYRRD